MLSVLASLQPQSYTAAQTIALSRTFLQSPKADYGWLTSTIVGILLGSFTSNFRVFVNPVRILKLENMEIWKSSEKCGAF